MAKSIDPFDFFGQWQSLLSKGVASNTSNPFDPFGLLRAAPAEFSKLFDPLEAVRAMAGGRALDANLQKVVDSQSKNLEALQQAQQVAASGMFALLQRQADMLRETLEEVTRSTQAAAKGAGTEELTAKQAAALKEAGEKGFATLRELTELVAKTNSETFEAINKRFSEGIAEIRDIVTASL